jgi:predicted double-glycine peptidase
MRVRLAGLCALLCVSASCATTPQSTHGQEFMTRYRQAQYCHFSATTQSAEYTCGAACLTSVLRYWDVPVPENSILRDYPTEEPGYSLVELRDIAREKGLLSYLKLFDESPRAGLSEQILLGRPLICRVALPARYPWIRSVPVLGPIYREMVWAFAKRRQHFVVAFGIHEGNLMDEGGVLVMDPAMGLELLPWSRFLPCWAGGGYKAILCGVSE